uniref:Uncharacterized protein n=1 Tax=Hucho hucho TaxID=62062 RepID=A0A4W5QNY1_9TELE
MTALFSGRTTDLYLVSSGTRSSNSFSYWPNALTTRLPATTCHWQEVWMKKKESLWAQHIEIRSRPKSSCTILQRWRETTRENLKNTKFLSIMSDGSTDSSVKEEELVYVRFCHKGKIQLKFVAIKSIEKGDAAHISNAISGIMEGVCDEWGRKLVSLGTDGAAVMTGAKNVVVSRLKVDWAYIIGIHCMAHRLELTFSDAIRSNVMFQKVENLLSGLCTFYHTSPLNRANLVNSFQALGDKPLVTTRIGGTQWVGHLLRALDHFL